MKKIALADIDMDNRPELARWLASKGDLTVWLWSDKPTTPEADKYAKKTLMLAVATATNKYMLLDTAGSKDKPDKLLVYITDDIDQFLGDSVPQTSGDKSRYIIISKDKVGRHKTVLTAEQQEQIKHWRQGKRGERLAINTIAKRLKVNNRTVMEFVRLLEATP